MWRVENNFGKCLFCILKIFVPLHEKHLIMYEQALMRLLYDEFGGELMDGIIYMSKDCLGWNNFVSDFSKHTNTTLIADLFEIKRNWNNKKMQFQYYSMNNPTNDNKYLSSLLNDAQLLLEKKERIKSQLSRHLSDLITLILDKSSSHSGGG